MRLHVVGLPHTQTTAAYNHCAYTAKVRKFASMMTAQGHDVILYAGDQNEADADLVTCITRAEQNELLGGYWWYRDGSIYGVDWNDELPYWQLFNQRVTDGIRDRVEDRDIVCLPAGWPMRTIAAAFPGQLVVEAGVGYEGVLDSTYRVFESYAWMHCVYGKRGPSATDGRFYDAVIPNFFEVDDFPAGDGGEDFVFMSRMTGRKGYQIAIDTAEAIGAKLKIAGIGGDRPEHDHVEYVGLADTQLRAELLGSARAVFVPTLYLEPFGGVAVEAMLCGTPVITTDWGAFTETVRHGIDGYRCRTMAEFIQAAHDVEHLDRAEIRENAISRYSTEAVGVQYDRYFDRLNTLWGAGFYAAPRRSPTIHATESR